MQEISDEVMQRLRVFTPDGVLDDEMLYLYWRDKYAKPETSWTTMLGSQAWKAWMAALVGAAAPVLIAWSDGSLDEQIIRTALESGITATVGFIAVWLKNNGNGE